VVDSILVITNQLGAQNLENTYYVAFGANNWIASRFSWADLVPCLTPREVMAPFPLNNYSYRVLNLKRTHSVKH
jgi:hypothetical protein